MMDPDKYIAALTLLRLSKKRQKANVIRVGDMNYYGIVTELTNNRDVTIKLVSTGEEVSFHMSDLSGFDNVDFEESPEEGRRVHH